MEVEKQHIVANKDKIACRFLNSAAVVQLRNFREIKKFRRGCAFQKRQTYIIDVLDLATARKTVKESDTGRKGMRLCKIVLSKYTTLRIIIRNIMSLAIL